MQDFNKITPREGRTMIKEFGLPLLPDWDIADAMIFEVVKKGMNIGEK